MLDWMKIRNLDLNNLLSQAFAIIAAINLSDLSQFVFILIAVGAQLVQVHSAFNKAKSEKKMAELAIEDKKLDLQIKREALGKG